MYVKDRQPNYLLWSIPFWIAAVLLAAYVVFGRGGGDGDVEPRIVFAETQTSAAPTRTPTPTPTQPPAPTSTVAPTSTPAPTTYTVQPGDSLTSICDSELPDLPNCLEAVVALNGLAGPDVIQVGQVLQLPPSPSAPGGTGSIATATPTTQPN